MKQFSTELQNSVRELNKAGDALQSVGKSMSLYFTAPIVAAGGAAIKMASDYSESLNKVDVAFKGSSDGVQAWAKTTLTSFGIAEGTALDMAALFGDMATSMGLPEAQAAKLSTSLVGLAGDLASFKNIGIDEATTALNGVFTGETESLKRLGIVMTEANLAQFALSQGITKNIKDFSQAEKVQLRYAYVMEQTKNAQGDFARTGGGAANQMRVFQESLKELAVQFGTEMLPLFTDLIKKLNDVVAGFKDLDPETRQIVIGIAAITAAIGPLSYAVGGMIKQFNALRVALLANPFTALAAALAAMAVVFVTTTSRFTALTNVQEKLASVSATAAESIVQETTSMNLLLKTAQDETKSKEQRQQAIEALNKLSPEYLGNLTLENVSTAEGKKLTDEYTASLLKKAKAQAAYNELVEVQTKLQRLQNSSLESVKPSVWQTLGNSFKSMGNNAAFAYEQTKTMADNLKVETASLTELEKKLTDIIEANGGVAESTLAAASAVKGAWDGVAKAGSVDWYSAQIQALEKLKNGTALNRDQVIQYEAAIKNLQAKIDKLQGKRVVVEVVTIHRDEYGDSKGDPIEPVGLKDSDTKASVKYAQREIDNLKQVREAYSETSSEYQNLSQMIAGHQLYIDVNTDPLKAIKATALDTVPAVDAATLALVKLNEAGGSALEGLGNYAAGFANAFDDMTGRFIESLGLANEGMQGFFKGLAVTILKIISAFLAQAIAAAIAGATLAGAATGALAVITTPAFIAESVAGVLAAFAAIPKFEDGGIIGGSSFHGDKLLARVNSGEMILNQDQQKRVYDMINPALNAGDLSSTSLSGEFTLRGEDLVLSAERTKKKNNRNR